MPTPKKGYYAADGKQVPSIIEIGDAYIAAWRRQDHKTCIAIARYLRDCGAVDWRGLPDNRSPDQKDHDELADEARITGAELLRGE